MPAPHSDRPTLFCLHFLGGSARSWSLVVDRLAPALTVIPLDLPGFGDNVHLDGHAVSAMADHVAAAIRARPGRFVLAGHSMGAKVAAALGRRAEDGEAGLDALAGLVLVAGSPSSPEPIPPDRRRAMLSWFDDATVPGAERAARADGFIAGNVGKALPPAAHALAVADVLRADARAWRAWLTHGSNEDWSATVGVLRTPTLIVAGGADADLGPDAQASLVAPHFASADLLVLEGAGHLLPLERPDALADAIARFVAGLATDAAIPAPVAIPDLYRRLIESDRVSTRTRAALLDRASPSGDGPASPVALTPPVLAILRAALRRVLPQDDGSLSIDLARRIDATLAAGGGDGWRHETLPPDRDAMRLGLLTLDAAARAGEGGRPFVVLDGDAQDALLAAIASGEPPPAGPDLPDAPPLDTTQMKIWFEELRALAVRAWVSHPATLARLGHSGIAYGGDGPDKPGFRLIGLGEREDWEPIAAADAADGVAR